MKQQDASGQLSLRSWGLYTQVLLWTQDFDHPNRGHIRGTQIHIDPSQPLRAGQGRTEGPSCLRTDCSDWARQVAIRGDSEDQEPLLLLRYSSFFIKGLLCGRNCVEHLGPHRLLSRKASNQGGIHIGLHRDPDRAMRLGGEATSKTGL